MPTSACASPQGRGRYRQTPPQKKNRGGGRERPTTTKLPTNTATGGQIPHPEGTEDRTPQKGHRRTTQPKPATPSQEQRRIGKRDTQNTQTHTMLGRKKNKTKTQKRSPGERG